MFPVCLCLLIPYHVFVSKSMIIVKSTPPRTTSTPLFSQSLSPAPPLPDILYKHPMGSFLDTRPSNSGDSLRNLLIQYTFCRFIQSLLIPQKMILQKCPPKRTLRNMYFMYNSVQSVCMQQLVWPHLKAKPTKLSAISPMPFIFLFCFLGLDKVLRSFGPSLTVTCLIYTENTGSPDDYNPTDWVQNLLNTVKDEGHRTHSIFSELDILRKSNDTYEWREAAR